MTGVSEADKWFSPWPTRLFIPELAYEITEKSIHSVHKYSLNILKNPLVILRLQGYYVWCFIKIDFFFILVSIDLPPPILPPYGGIYDEEVHLLNDSCITHIFHSKLNIFSTFLLLEMRNYVVFPFTTFIFNSLININLVIHMYNCFSLVVVSTLRGMEQREIFDAV